MIKQKNTILIFQMLWNLDSMFRVAEIVLLGAINRKESRGAHAQN